MTDTLSLFDHDVARDIDRLKELAHELALRNGRHGITVGDLRLAAETRGILTGHESLARMKALNLGQVPRKAGLYRTEERRASRINRAHGNQNFVWVVREFAEVA
jgi:hypothetical protein